MSSRFAASKALNQVRGTTECVTAQRIRNKPADPLVPILNLCSPPAMLYLPANSEAHEKTFPFFAGSPFRSANVNTYCFNFSQKLNGLTKMINSPGLGEAMGLPQVLAVTTPCRTNCFVEIFFTASQE